MKTTIGFNNGFSIIKEDISKVICYTGTHSVLGLIGFIEIYYKWCDIPLISIVCNENEYNEYLAALKKAGVIE